MEKIIQQLTGMETLQRALVKAPDVVKAHAGDAVSASTFALASRARTMAPRRSGDLRRAIESSARGLSGRVGLADIQRRGRSTALYWRFVEFGTVRMPAQPFMRPAADREADDYLRRLRAIGPKLERDLSAGRFV